MSSYSRETSINIAYEYIQTLIKNGYTYKAGGVKYPTYDVTKSDLLKTSQICDKYGLPFEWLMNLMRHESASTFNPAIKNSIGATGLIQFMTRINGTLMSYAKADGTGSIGTSELRKLTYSEQIEYVDGFLYRGLKRRLVNGKLPDTFSQGQLFMTIFYPVAVSDPDYVFPAKVQKANGVATPKEYTKKALSGQGSYGLSLAVFPLNYYPFTIAEAKQKFGKDVVSSSPTVLVNSCEPFKSQQESDNFRVWLNEKYPAIAGDVPGLPATSSDRTVAKTGNCDSSNLKAAANHKIEGKTLLEIFRADPSAPAITNPTNTGNTQPIAQEQTKVTADTEDNKTKNTSLTGQIRKIFKNTLKPKPIEITFEGVNQGNQQIIAQTLGFTPTLFYNGSMIQPNDVKKFRLFHEGLVPKIECTIFDTFGIFKNTGKPVDDTKISLFLDTRSKYLASIRVDFKIVNFNSGASNTYILEAIIDVPKLYTKNYASVPAQTSFSTLQQIAKECGLGFVTNITDTLDSQTWINTGMTYREFIKKIVDKSYITDESFQVCYIDYYYNLVYVDLTTEFRRNIDNDLAVSATGFDKMTAGTGKTDVDDRIEPMILTTERNLGASPFFIEKFIETNNSTAISVSEGYRSEVKYLDPQKKEIVYFKVESQSDAGDKSEPLRSNSGDDQFYNQNSKSVYTGKIDSFENDGNTHGNAGFAMASNKRNKIDLFKLTARATLPKYNFNLYPYRKVPIQLVLPAPTPDQPEGFDTKLSGEWMILGQEFQWQAGATKMILEVCKRSAELGPNEQIQKSQPVEQKNTKTEKNELPPGQQQQQGQQQNQQQQDQSGSSTNAPIQEVEFGQMADESVVPQVASDGRTSPSGYIMKSTSYSRDVRQNGTNGSVNQIVLHYSAGWQLTDKCKGVQSFLMTREWGDPPGPYGLSYHYIISVDGHIENLVNPINKAFHSTGANARSIGISLEGLGVTYTSIKEGNRQVDKYRKNARYQLYKLCEDYVDLVDFDGNPTKIRSYTVSQEVSVAQLKSLEQLLKKIRKQFPEIPSWNGLTKEKYDILFPKQGTSYSKAPGFYTHTSITTGKNDALPTPRLVNFLKRLRF